MRTHVRYSAPVPAHEILAATPGLSGRLLTGAQLERLAPGRDVLPVDSWWSPIVPGGSLQRGKVYACGGTGARSMALSLVARAVTVGSWLAVVDVDDLGYGAMADLGVALERVVSVEHDRDGDVARTVGALCDGFDLVVVGRLHGRTADLRRLVSRVQVQQTVLVVLAEASIDSPLSPDIIFTGETSSWMFDSHARSRRLTVRCSGRRVPGESVHDITLPFGSTG